MQKSGFNIAIIGLGLMGGSLAYALHGFKDGTVTGFDTDIATLKLALEREAIGRAAASLREAVTGADLTIFCSSPNSIIKNMRQSLPYFKQDSVVTDICGIKKDILAFVRENFPPHIDYVGLHPMAGKEVSGFENADTELFKNAGFILVLSDNCKESSVGLLKELSSYVGAGRIAINHADDHDALIAYTSDLMHIAATALCADYPENITMAHAAGAFRDCTRIACIDADLWTELLIGNSGNIVPYLSGYIQNLTAFRNALKSGDKEFIHAFLRKASDNKAKMLTL